MPRSSLGASRAPNVGTINTRHREQCEAGIPLPHSRVIPVYLLACRHIVERGLGVQAVLIGSGKPVTAVEAAPVATSANAAETGITADAVPSRSI